MSLTMTSKLSLARPPPPPPCRRRRSRPRTRRRPASGRRPARSTVHRRPEGPTRVRAASASGPCLATAPDALSEPICSRSYRQNALEIEPSVERVPSEPCQGRRRRARPKSSRATRTLGISSPLPVVISVPPQRKRGEPLEMSATEREAAEPRDTSRTARQGPAGPLLPSDAGHPAHGRGAGQGLRAAQIRRVPAPLHRARGGGGRGSRGAQAGRLRDRHLPRARARLRQGDERQVDHRRAVRQGHRLLEGAGRLDAPLRRREELPGRLRDRRRAHPAGGRHRLRVQVPRRRPGHALLLRRRLRPAGGLPRGRRAGGALAAAGGLHLREQPLLDGDAALPVALGLRRLAEGAGLRHRARPLRRRGRRPGARSGRPRRSAARATSRCRR